MGGRAVSHLAQVRSGRRSAILDASVAPTAGPKTSDPPFPVAQRTVQENFPVALRILPPALRRDLTSLYRFARFVDDLGDEFTGNREPALRAVIEDLHRLYGGRPAHIDEVAGLSTLHTARGVPIDPLLALVQANLQDQLVTRYRTFAELLAYCSLSANPVGAVVLHIVGAVGEESARPRPGRRRTSVDPAALMVLSDRICTGLQLLEHWQDIGQDYRAGRIYLPQQDMDRFDVTEADLGRSRVSAALRNLLRFETDRASAYLGAGAPLIPSLPRWGRLAVSGYLAGGRAAAAELRRKDFEVLTADCKPGAGQIAGAWLLAHLQSAG